MSISNPNPNPNQGNNSNDNNTNAMADEESSKQTIPNSVYVSFSKRRQGLFQKASELCTKCGAEVAVLVLSPAGNPSSFGHSSVDQVLSRFLNGGPSSFQAPSFGSGNNSDADNVIEDQKRQLEGLRKRAKLDHHHQETVQREPSIEEWVEREFVERSSSVEELEFLKQKYLLLIHKIATRLIGN